jgi:hypothetical protein
MTLAEEWRAQLTRSTASQEGLTKENIMAAIMGGQADATDRGEGSFQIGGQPILFRFGVSWRLRPRC